MPADWVLYDGTPRNSLDEVSKMLDYWTNVAGQRVVGVSLMIRRASGDEDPARMEHEIRKCGRAFGKIIRYKSNLMDLGLAINNWAPTGVATRADVRVASEFGGDLMSKWCAERLICHLLPKLLTDCGDVCRIGSSDFDYKLAWCMDRDICRTADFEVHYDDGRCVMVEEKSDQSPWNPDKDFHIKINRRSMPILFSSYDGLGYDGVVPESARIRCWLMPWDFISKFPTEKWFHSTAYVISYSEIDAHLIADVTVNSDEINSLLGIFIEEARGDGWEDVHEGMMEHSTPILDILSRSTFSNRWTSRRGEQEGREIRLSHQDSRRLQQIIRD